MTDFGDSRRRENDRPADNSRSIVETRTRARIERAVERARLNLAWEGLWPLLAPFVGLFGLFAILSWFGLWRFTSAPVRVVVLAAFAAVAAYLAFRAVKFRWPDRTAGLSRVEQATGALHRPATAYADRLATARDDPASQALWLAHRQRLLAALERLKAGVPSPKLAKSDPYALRFLVLLLFVVGLVYAGPERIERLGEAFRGGETRAATVARIDAWVTPPTYTSRPPIFLTGDAAKAPGTEYSVPTGSLVTVRTGGTRDLNVVSSNAEGDTAIAPMESATTATRNRSEDATPPLEHQITLSEAGNVVVKKGDREVAGWRFVVEPDNPPEIALLESPETMTSGALRLSYSLLDDFGVISGMAEVGPAEQGDIDTAARPLFDAPTFPLSLPQLRTRSGNGETTRDLTSHPWAGAKVTLTLVARDEADQEGRSAPLEMTLPARRFSDPLARAVVEQRANLALDANAAGRVADALDALTMAPEETISDYGDYLALRSAYYRTINARDDDELRALVEYLWTVALGIEDGDLSLAAQRLRDAQEALRQALEDGASDEEIQRLAQELREAMQEFLQALAEEAMRNPQIANIPPNGDMQTLRSQDLERMLDRIEDLARTGARDAARQLLSELQNMLENLQAGRPMMGDQQGNNQMMESLNQLGEMIRRQEELMNRTYRSDQGMGEDGQQMTPEQLEEALRQLQQGQEGLGQSLQELMEQLDGMGMAPNGKLGQAGEAMGRAAGALGEGKPGSAVGDQGEALEALRQGAQGMAQQLANQPGQGGGMRGGDNFPNTDPLGRPQRTTGPDLGTTVRVPDEIDTQRAREILDAIRRRLGDFSRPEIERDYLERLLDKF
jgi:uncharacterized protein (TIGR02302 family)